MWLMWLLWWMWLPWLPWLSWWVVVETHVVHFVLGLDEPRHNLHLSHRSPGLVDRMWLVHEDETLLVEELSVTPVAMLAATIVLVATMKTTTTTTVQTSLVPMMDAPIVVFEPVNDPKTVKDPKTLLRRLTTHLVIVVNTTIVKTLRCLTTHLAIVVNMMTVKNLRCLTTHLAIVVNTTIVKTLRCLTTLLETARRSTLLTTAAMAEMAVATSWIEQIVEATWIEKTEKIARTAMTARTLMATMAWIAKNSWSRRTTSRIVLTMLRYVTETTRPRIDARAVANTKSAMDAKHVNGRRRCYRRRCH